MKAKRKGTKREALSILEQRFVPAYVKSGNATHAARIAGYTGDDATLATQGSRLLRRPKVAQAISEMVRRTERASIATREELMEGLTAIWRGEQLATIGVDKDGHAIKGPPSHVDRTRAATLMAKMSGFLVERREVQVDATVSTKSVHVVLMVPHSNLGPPPATSQVPVALPERTGT